MAKSIAANSIYNFLLKFFRIVLPVLINSYVMRTIDPTLYGIFSDASSWVNIAIIFGVFGSYAYGIREAARVRESKEQSSSLFSSLFVINFVTNSAALILYPCSVFFHTQRCHANLSRAWTKDICEYFYGGMA